MATAQGKKGGFWSSKSQVGGVFFLVAVIVIAIIAAILFFIFRRRRPSDVATIQSTTGNNTPQRRPSRLSQMGLIGGVQRQAAVPSIQTSGWGPGNSTEKSPADTLNADRRSSYAKANDHRLEPTALWNPLHNNGSHNSMQSFRDDQDYSRRMLRVSPSDLLHQKSEKVHGNMLIIVRLRTPRIVSFEFSRAILNQQHRVDINVHYFDTHVLVSCEIRPTASKFLMDIGGSTNILALYQSHGYIPLHEYFRDTLCICVLPRKPRLALGSPTDPERSRVMSVSLITMYNSLTTGKRVIWVL